MSLEHIIKEAIDALPSESDVRILIERSTAKFSIPTPPETPTELNVEVSDKMEIKGN